MGRVSQKEVEKILRVEQRVRAPLRKPHHKIIRQLGRKRYRELYSEILRAQKGKCAICGKNAEDYERRFSIDHCHRTQRIRGVLCAACNSRVGFLEKYEAKIRKYLNDSVDWMPKNG